MVTGRTASSGQASWGDRTRDAISKLWFARCESRFSTGRYATGGQLPARSRPPASPRLGAIGTPRPMHWTCPVHHLSRSAPLSVHNFVDNRLAVPVCTGLGFRHELGVTTRGHCGAGRHLLLLRTARASGRAVVRADWVASQVRLPNSVSLSSLPTAPRARSGLAPRLSSRDSAPQSTRRGASFYIASGWRVASLRTQPLQLDGEFYGRPTPTPSRASLSFTLPDWSRRSDRCVRMPAAFLTLVYPFHHEP